MSRFALCVSYAYCTSILHSSLAHQPPHIEIPPLFFLHLTPTPHPVHPRLRTLVLRLRADEGVAAVLEHEEHDSEAV